MGLSRKKKKFIKKNLGKKTLAEIALNLGVPQKEIEIYLEKIWGKEKYKKFLEKEKQLQGEIRPEKNEVITSPSPKSLKKFPFFLAILICIVYFNSLKNDFLSDDISGILQNPNLDETKYIFTDPFSFFHNLIYVLITRIFGRIPAFFRMVNIVSHLGTTLTLYFLISFLFNPVIALFSSSLFAIHPILSESVNWISAGYYSLSAFLALSSFLTYFLFFKTKHLKYYLLSVFLYFLALETSEKIIIFPFILIFFEICFGKLKENWKKILPFLSLSLLWIYYLVRGFGNRMVALQTQFYQEPQIFNPLIQIPIAITSYLELIFWPKNLTFYHSELTFTQTQYFLRLGVFILFLGAILYFFKKNRPISFWLSFFIISLSPTLTPFGISWIVAERYVYLGVIGIFVVVAYFFEKLTRIEKFKPWTITIFSLIVIALSIRTIIRNTDWRNQDTLWIATAKVSPSSHQNHNNLGDMYARHGNLEKAIEEFKKAIKLKPNYADAYHNLANVYHQMGKNELAKENYQKALEFNPGLWQSHQNLAGLYFLEEKFDLAENHLLKTVEINSVNPELYINLGILYKKMGKKEKASEALQKALSWDPQNQKAKQLLLQLFTPGR